MADRPDTCTILAPTAILGYGFPEASFRQGLALGPDLIAVDAGSVDPGPYYLGAGVSFTDRAAVKRDLHLMIAAGLERGIPVLVGSCGGSGARPHLDWTRGIVAEILAELGRSARVAEIPADIDREEVLAAIDAGRTLPLDGLPPLDRATVDATGHIVAQMGIEPFIDALERGFEIVLAGRAYDPAVFAALPVMRGFDPGLAVHLGKILECAAIAAVPGSGSDCALGILEHDSFTLVPLNEERRFTAESVAAHSLYEKSDPCRLPGPDGELDLSGVEFVEEPGGKVRVRGSRMRTGPKRYLKLEGTRRVGFRTVSIAGVRDPIMIAGLDDILAAVQERVGPLFAAEGVTGSLYFHLYGRNGVMGRLEPEPAAGHEIGIVIEAVAATQAEADSICSLTRSTLLHYGYPGRIATAGNLAFPFSPSDIKAGPVYEFSIYHLMEVAGRRLFTPSEVSI